MIPVEAWTTIRYLFAQGKGKRTIARELGISRNTVRRALARAEPPKYQRPPRPNPQLAPFTQEIQRMRGERFIGTRILRELRQWGYQGSRSALYSYLSQLKEEGPDPRVCLRYETQPGQQFQFDWSPYTVDLGGIVTRVVVFSTVASYSRSKHFTPSLDARQESIYGALEESLGHLGGAPKQVLVDNDGSLVVDARPGHFRWNPRFLELCGHYGIQPIACRVGQPRGKGKVERPFFSLEEQFIKGGHWRDFDHFCQELARYEEDLNQEVHGTTGEPPVERLHREAAHLLPLPAARYLKPWQEQRKVSWDGLVSFRGNRYGVPWAYAGQRIWVQTRQGYRLEVVNQKGEVVASHLLAQGKKGIMVLLEGQYAGLRGAQPKTLTVLRERFLEKFPRHRLFLEQLYRRQQSNAAFHLRSILDLARIYPREVLAEAFRLAEEYQAFSQDFIRGVVEQQGQLVPPPVPVSPLSLRPVPALVVQGDLAVYQELLAGRGWR